MRKNDDLEGFQIDCQDNAAEKKFPVNALNLFPSCAAQTLFRVV